MEKCDAENPNQTSTDLIKLLLKIDKAAPTETVINEAPALVQPTQPAFVEELELLSMIKCMNSTSGNGSVANNANSSSTPTHNQQTLIVPQLVLPPVNAESNNLIEKMIGINLFLIIQLNL